jgi:hypothetical protein
MFAKGGRVPLDVDAAKVTGEGLDPAGRTGDRVLPRV